MTLAPEWITPQWGAPRHVRAFVTTRAGGVSVGEYASMNLGFSSGDDPGSVAANRAIARRHLPADPEWLAQVHGTTVVDLDRSTGERPRADAAATSTPGRVAVVLTADCMPLFLADRAGRRVAVVHAGWRGMSAGVIENAVREVGDAADIEAWMGPTIGAAAFEVGPEVKAAFEASDPSSAREFMPKRPGKFLADLYGLARRRLERAGVQAIHGGGFCTFNEPARFFSYRREQKSGRMGAFIWIEP